MRWIALLGLFAGSVLVAAGEGQGVIVVRGWQAPSGGQAGFNIYMSEISGRRYRKLNPQPVTALTYTVTGLTQGQRYFFVLTQVTKDVPPVESRPSGEFSLVADDPGPGWEARAPEAAPEKGWGLDFEDKGAYAITTWKRDPSSLSEARPAQDRRHGGSWSLHLRSTARGGTAAGADLRGLDPADCPFSVRGAAALTLWVYAQARTYLGVGMVEGKGRGADGETWLAPAKAVPKAGEWVRMRFPLIEFKPVRSARSAPSASAGHENDRLDLACMEQIRVWLASGRAEVHVDDIRFE